MNPNAKIFIPKHIRNNSKATSDSRNLNTQISRGDLTENSMLNLSPIANNLVTPVLSSFSDDYRENDSCDSTNSNSVVNVASNHSNVENLLDPITILNEIRMKFVKNVIIGLLNINALANKFYALNLIKRDKLDILVLCETKLDASFTERQFFLTGFKKPYRLDRNKHGGGVMVYVRDDIPSVELKKHTFSKKMEAIFVEINLRKNIFLLVGTYHSIHPYYGLNDNDYFEQIGFALDIL